MLCYCCSFKTDKMYKSFTKPAGSDYKDLRKSSIKSNMTESTHGDVQMYCKCIVSITSESWQSDLPAVCV